MDPMAIPVILALIAAPSPLDLDNVYDRFLVETLKGMTTVAVVVAAESGQDGEFWKSEDNRIRAIIEVQLRRIGVDIYDAKALPKSEEEECKSGKVDKPGCRRHLAWTNNASPVLMFWVPSCECGDQLCLATFRLDLLVVCEVRGKSTAHLLTVWSSQRVGIYSLADRSKVRDDVRRFIEDHMDELANFWLKANPK